MDFRVKYLWEIVQAGFPLIIMDVASIVVGTHTLVCRHVFGEHVFGEHVFVTKFLVQFARENTFYTFLICMIQRVY